MPGRPSRARLTALVAAVVVLGAARAPAVAGFGSRASAGGSVAAAALAAPTGLTVTGTSVANLTWTPSPSPFATGTRVLRSTTPGGGYAAIATVPDPGETTYHDNSVAPGTYWYAVEAYYRNWSSPRSNEAGLAVVASAVRQAASTSHGNSTVTSTTATFSRDPSADSLLVAVGAARRFSTAGLTMPGWTRAVLTPGAGDLQQAIFYKRSAGPADRSMTLEHGPSIGAVAVQAYEFAASVPSTLVVSGADASTEAGTILRSGQVLGFPSSLVFAAVVSDAGSGNDDATWTGGFHGSGFQRGGNAGNRAVFGSAWRTTDLSVEYYGTEVTGTVSANWKGQIVAFG